MLESIKNKIGCSNIKDNLWLHIKTVPGYSHSQYNVEHNPNNEWWCVGIVGMHAPLKKDGSFADGYYAMISKNKLNDYIGQYKNLIKKTRTNKKGDTVKMLGGYFPFNTYEEALNFENFLQTDFVHICLYFIKYTADFMNGELKYIPWQDFTQEWNDYKLFKKYNISKEEIEKIYLTIPNYYNIERINLDEY